MDNKYLEVVYNFKDRPLTNYPEKLAKYLVNEFKINENDKFLELGCGRGDFINEFTKLKLDTFAIDNNDFYKDLKKSDQMLEIEAYANQKKISQTLNGYKYFCLKQK